MADRKIFIRIGLLPLMIGMLAACGESSSPAEKSTTPGTDTADTTSETSSLTPLPDEYSLMSYWAGNAAEEYYFVTERDGNTIIDYEDVTGETAGGWAYVSRSFFYDAADIARFGEYKKISFTGKLEKTSGSDVVMVKVEGDGGTFEKKFNFSSGVKTYEFGLNFVSDWTKVNSLLFFVNRETGESGNGKITLSKCCLSKEEVNAEYDIAPGMPSVPQDWNIYKGGDKLDVMYRWGYDPNEQIKAEQVDGAYKFSWGEVAKTAEWAYVSAMIKGDDDHPLAESGFKRIVFEFTGTAGQSALFKFQDKANTAVKEVTVNLTGAAQTVEVDVTTSLSRAAEDAFLACIFPGPGKTGASIVGELTLIACYLDKNELSDDTVNVATADEVYFDNVSKIDAIYQFTNQNHVSTINFNKTASGWDNIQFTIKLPDPSWDIKTYTKVSGTFNSTYATKILIKPFDSNALQTEVTLPANEDVAVDFTIENTDAMDLTKPMVLFIAPGDLTGQGVLTATNFKLSKPAA